VEQEFDLLVGESVDFDHFLALGYLPCGHCCHVFYQGGNFVALEIVRHNPGQMALTTEEWYSSISFLFLLGAGSLQRERLWEKPTRIKHERDNSTHMTIAVKNPLPRLTRQRLMAVFAIVVFVVAVGVPVGMYWALQRSDLHLRWDLESRYAEQLLFHMESASALLNGNLYTWSNQTAGSALEELVYADYELQSIMVLDRAHLDQLNGINYALESLNSASPKGTEVYIASLNSSQRILLSTQVYSFGHDLANAYNNFVNYGGTSPGIGPSFWYSGPSPPDENLLQSAVSIALTFERQ